MQRHGLTPSVSARRLAEQEEIDVRLYSIIYNAINEVKAAMEGMLAPDFEEKIICNVEVREVFKIPKVGTVAGCMVTDGKVNRNTKIRIIRDGIVVFSGELSSLKRFKDDAKDVQAGMECGLSITNYNDIRVGDNIEGYENVAVKRTLAFNCRVVFSLVFNCLICGLVVHGCRSRLSSLTVA